MELIDIVNNLRKRVCEYRLLKMGVKEISTDLNAVDIVLALVDLAIKDKRAIKKEEENWFRAGLYLSYVFSGSEWEDIPEEFEKIVYATEKLNYFRPQTANST
ncbi:hypothetical protein ACFSQD_18165 [Flavihumibacter stibioxidans]|uniref:Uncharacterized protein n=1 Tax=Flavihumibacter stibioxidans TaxID=1834163 RepID=A0ABR7M6J3_9BACT|nr:hypothetical protein [Flavihumibacter stibioxidans]MBC6490648.1 hypothetical protein [Flavihumibacter stibioxidans]